jgi:replicative DNA helicase
MAALGEEIADTALLTRKLKGTRFWVEIGRASGMAAMATECPNPKNAKHYAAIVREAADRRRLSVIAKDFYESLMDANKPTTDSVASLEARIQVSGLHAGGDAKRIWEASEDAVNRIVKARESKYEVGVQTGLYSVDYATGGLFPEELTVLAARPSIGKSAMASQIAYASAMAGRPALFVSLEMAEWELAGRTLAAESSVNASVIRSASVSDDQIAELRHVVDQQRPLPLWFWRPQRATVAQIRAKAREISATTPLALIVVDYLQLVKPEDHRMFRRDQMAQIGRDLKELANEMRVAMLALSQLNREGEGNKPSLSQLSESGTIEQDANAVWLLHRESRAAEDALLMIEKNRSGVTGELQLRYDGSKTLFYCPQVSEFS